MARSVHLVLRPTLGGCGAFEILDGDKPRLFYIFKEIHCAIGGRGFAIRRAGREMYHVRIGKRHECECECPGFLRHGYCRHILSLLALEKHGKLEPAESVVAEPGVSSGP
jgi:hypothetical protein